MKILIQQLEDLFFPLSTNEFWMNLHVNIVNQL